MILDARKRKNAIMMFYLKANRYPPKRSKPQEENTNIPEEKKDGNENKVECLKKLGLSSEMNINVVHRYSHLGGKLFCITYNALRVKSTGTLQVCDGCARTKSRASDVRKKTYIGA